MYFMKITSQHNSEHKSKGWESYVFFILNDFNKATPIHEEIFTARQLQGYLTKCIWSGKRQVNLWYWTGYWTLISEDKTYKLNLAINKNLRSRKPCLLHLSELLSSSLYFNFWSQNLQSLNGNLRYLVVWSYGYISRFVFSNSINSLALHRQSSA